MKALMILGAMVGFAIGAGFGLASESPAAATLWRACAAALVSALLTRWWSQVWLRGLRESLEQRASSSRTNSAKPIAKA